MPIDEQTYAPMIQMYLQWQQEFEEKGTPDEFKQRLNDVIEEFRAVAREVSSMEEFMQITTEKGLAQKAGMIYSESFMATSQPQTSTGENKQEDDISEDKTEQVQKAFDLNIKSVKEDRERALQEEDRAWEIPFWDRMIELYDSGISYPLYLKALEEEGIHEKMRHTSSIRDMLVEGVENNKQTRNLPNIELWEELLTTWDKLCDESPAGIPNHVVWEVTDFTIRMKYMPRQVEWDMRDLLFHNLLNLTHDWIDSWTKWAPKDPRWFVERDMEETMKRVKLTKYTNAGMAKVTEEILKEYFGIGWDEMFSEPEFLYLRESRDKIAYIFLPYTDHRLEFLKNEVWPQMQPMQPPPPALIAKAEEVYGNQYSEEHRTDEDMDKKYEEMLSKMSKEQREEHYHYHKNKKQQRTTGRKSFSPNIEDNLPPSIQKEMNL